MDGTRRSWVDRRSAVPVALTLTQLGYAGFVILCKAALRQGTNRLVFAVYRDTIAVLILGPVAYFSERELRTPLSGEGVIMVMICGLTGVYLFQILYLIGLTYTSASFAAATPNIIPVFAFIIGVVFRVEVIHYSRRDGVAQVLGVVACVTGAMIMTLYRGPALLGSGRGTSTLVALPLTGLEMDSWTYGSLALVAASMSVGIFFNVQKCLFKKYPAPISITALAYLVGTLLLAVSGFFMVEDPSDWVLVETTTLIAVAYAGVVSSAISFTVEAYCCHKSGPVMVTMFSPLQTMFGTLLAFIFLGETYYLGSAVGALLVIASLCLVTWGQAEAERLEKIPSNVLAVTEDKFFVRRKDSVNKPLLG